MAALEAAGLVQGSCRVLLFLSQLYVLSGRASLSSHSQAQLSHPQAPRPEVGVVPRSTHVPASKVPEPTGTPPYVNLCPSNGPCGRLPPDCVSCKANNSCIYGKPVLLECQAKPRVHCIENPFPETFAINMTCQFCWQLPPSDYTCSNATNCKTVSCPRERYRANCTVKDHIHCLDCFAFGITNGKGAPRIDAATNSFLRYVFSITLGGFGADRFYLGQWREGLGKLFSFGGLGIWTLIDVLLIGVGYVGPADGSLYI
ncbi:PREDICTED: TM2 domain-containing protein 3 [Gekko japonicus]|uniref:TM2 domain-containing protein 3 n=1 Tax=Gekko japonicus TaxID=146911 RepID=A0ABM1LFB2_GEKJA|nr:PREDICTED: TM2 domain-containing protein 3 [Gekko japonicus]